MSRNPWWHSSDDDLGLDEPLSLIIGSPPITALFFRCGVRALAISTGGIPSSRLGIAEGTVRKHLENIYTRLNVTSRTAAVTRAFPNHPGP